MKTDLDQCDKNRTNIIVIGPTGTGKSNLVNLLFNKKVVKSKGGIKAVSDGVQFVLGK